DRRRTRTVLRLRLGRRGAAGVRRPGRPRRADPRRHPRRAGPLPRSAGRPARGAGHLPGTRRAAAEGRPRHAVRPGRGPGPDPHRRGQAGVRQHRPERVEAAEAAAGQPRGRAGPAARAGPGVRAV
ncbi:MAG: hypothetical protein AVDCRST_MAG64-3770, partial [uncultured Phycisphaerae bacterium]